jgi:hypothetical protein
MHYKWIKSRAIKIFAFIKIMCKLNLPGILEKEGKSNHTLGCFLFWYSFY